MLVSKITYSLARVIPNPNKAFANDKPEVAVEVALDPTDDPNQVKTWLQGYVEVLMQDFAGKIEAAHEAESKRQEEEKLRRVSAGPFGTPPQTFPNLSPAQPRYPGPFPTIDTNSTNYNLPVVGPATPPQGQVGQVFPNQGVQPPHIQQQAAYVEHTPGGSPVAALSAQTLPAPVAQEPNYDDLLPPPTFLGAGQIIV